MPMSVPSTGSTASGWTRPAGPPPPRARSGSGIRRTSPRRCPSSSPWPRPGLAVGVKMGPGMPHDSVPRDCEAQWVSVGGDVTEVALWFNAVRRPAIRRAALLLGPAGRGGAHQRRGLRRRPGRPGGAGRGVPLRARRRRHPRRAGGRRRTPAGRAPRGRAHRLHLRPGTAGHPLCPGLQGPGGDAVQRQGAQGLGQGPAASACWTSRSAAPRSPRRSSASSCSPAGRTRQEQGKEQPPWSSPGSARSGWPSRWSRSRFGSLQPGCRIPTGFPEATGPA